MTEAIATTLIPPPPPPRAVTPAARTRSWMEPRVRMWWLVALVMLGIAIYFAVTQYTAWRTRADLIENGTEVEAEVLRADSPDIRGRVINPGEVALIRFTHNGQRRDVRSTFPTRLQAGVTRPIRIDPTDPERWTLETQAPPLGKELVGLWVVLPLVPLALLVAWLMRRGVLKTWQTGDAHAATVVDARATAFSPMSRTARCTLNDSNDKRLITVTIPARKHAVTPDEIVYLIVPAGRYDKAIAAAAFQ